MVYGAVADQGGLRAWFDFGIGYLASTSGEA